MDLCHYKNMISLCHDVSTIIMGERILVKMNCEFKKNIFIGRLMPMLPLKLYIISPPCSGPYLHGERGRSQGAM